MSKLSGVESSRVESIPIMMDCDNFIGILLKSLAMSCDLHICRDDMTPYRIVSHGLGVVVLLGMMLCRVESKVFKITSAFWLVGFSILNQYPQYYVIITVDRQISFWAVHDSPGFYNHLLSTAGGGCVRFLLHT
jgi:hypothetical protein